MYPKQFIDKDHFTKFCWDNAENIYVREQVKGKWGPYNLNEISKERADYWIDLWYTQNRIPVMVVG